MIYETERKTEIPNSLPLLLTVEEQIETLLKKELSKIQVLNGNVYPLAVPESVPAPYIAYVQAGGEYGRDLQGYDGTRSCDYEINILSAKYSQLKLIEKNVFTVLKSFIGMNLSESTIQDILINVPVEGYEEAVKLQRANIQFTVYF